MSTVRHVHTVVVWVDAVGGSRIGWRDLAEALKDCTVSFCVASGMVIKETKFSVTLAPQCSYHAGKVQQIDGELTIPRGWIVTRKDVSVSVPLGEPA